MECPQWNRLIFLTLRPLIWVNSDSDMLTKLTNTRMFSINLNWEYEFHKAKASIAPGRKYVSVQRQQ